MIKNIGFIGLGMMGHGMAANILDKGYLLTVMAHKNRKPIEDLLARGASEASSPKVLAAQNDAVLLCVRGAEEVESLVYGTEGLLQGCHQGMFIIDCTTSDPALSRKIAADVKKYGGHFADAPVTRAPRDAEAGRLNSLVGASDETFSMILPVLQAYSENITHFGSPGAGHSAKLINNFISMGYAALISEGMAMCSLAGVDSAKLYEVMSTGGADSGVLRKMVPGMLKGDLTGHQFSLGNALKDVSYFCRMAETEKFSSYLSDSLMTTYTDAVNAGFGDRFVASLIELHTMRQDKE
jgi:3-hydroxyisobutyrate dehydrogenase-like beta-hydroxyacid dehydrogenase